MSQMYVIEDEDRIEFRGKVVGGKIVLSFHAGGSSGALEERQAIFVNFTFDPSEVKFEVPDILGYTTSVYLDSSTRAWLKTNKVSNESVDMPAEGDDVAVVIRIEAKNNTGTLRRSQVVIIKHTGGNFRKA